LVKFLLHYHLKLAEACQQHQFRHGHVALFRGRGGDSLENATNRIATVGESGKDGKNRILQMWTAEQVFSGDVADIDDPAGIQSVGSSQGGWHP
jgi:hypothetical protein